MLVLELKLHGLTEALYFHYITYVLIFVVLRMLYFIYLLIYRNSKNIVVTPLTEVVRGGRGRATRRGIIRSTPRNIPRNMEGEGR